MRISQQHNNQPTKLQFESLEGLPMRLIYYLLLVRTKGYQNSESYQLFATLASPCASILKIKRIAQQHNHQPTKLQFESLAVLPTMRPIYCLLLVRTKGYRNSESYQLFATLASPCASILKIKRIAQQHNNQPTELQFESLVVLPSLLLH
jgi:hypothetical protein